MILYDLISRKIYLKCKVGHILCSVGNGEYEFIHPLKFRNSGKIAYGYALTDDTVVSLRRSERKFKWSVEDGAYYNSYIDKADKFTDGVENSDVYRELSDVDKRSLPAVSECISMPYAYKSSYMPSVYELSSLLTSVSTGWMRADLMTAGIYEECNYRLGCDGFSWDKVWSSTQYSNGKEVFSWLVSGKGGYNQVKRRDELAYVIPFYRF